MSFNIVEEVTKKLRLTSLTKVDPNTQAPVYFKEHDFDADHKLKYLAVPTVLVAFYKHTRNTEDTEQLFKDKSSGNMVEFLFGLHTDEIVQQVASNAEISAETARGQMNEVAAATKEILKERVPDLDPGKVSGLFTDQRSVILKHLPARLNLGVLMDDNAVDDRTNKMEGPASGLMHVIEKLFSSSK